MSRFWMVAALVAVYGCDDSGDSTTIIDGGGVAEPACSDGVDNDLDGLIDLEDPGCDGPDDRDETDVVRVQCNDGVDNDDDGLIDLADPACLSPLGDDESADPEPAACANGEDDDGDDLIDLADPGCGSSSDDDESDDPVRPECDNGLDDDNDGFIDFPQDPGCGSLFDDSESGERPPEAQCNNGVDDDNDGRVDLADPGCSSPADPREADPAEPPQCFNGLDDDGNGVIDFPYDPGCAAAGDDSEAAPDTVPACGNGLDDDGDRKIDFPFDPGCAGVGDRDETDPSVTPACADGVDNDNDGRIDYPDDRGCDSAADGTETGACGRNTTAIELDPGRAVVGSTRGAPFEAEGSCGGRGAPELVFLYRVERPLEALVITTEDPGTTLETTLYVRRNCQAANTELGCSREAIDGVAANTLRLPAVPAGDYYIYLDGASGQGGNFVLHVNEIALAECLNGLDDDADGRVDFPSDPGCERRDDRTEADPDPLPECADGQDNDGDGFIDFPGDVGCRAAGDNDEVDLCGPGVRTYEYAVGEPFLLDDTSMGGTTQFSGSCRAGSNGPEKVYVYDNPFNANLTISVDYPETIASTVVYVRTTCLGAGSELGCDEGNPNDLASTRGVLELDRVPPGEIYIFVDHPFGMGGAIKLSIEAERLPPGCVDRIDNDEDGFIDDDDIGCSGPEDEDERDPPEGMAAPACFDGLDNDEDGLTDYPNDPGCGGKGYPSEVDPAVLPECANGVDDDDDALIDYPLDTGCSARGDNSEAADRQRPQCNNVIDDDADGVIDFPNDPGCAAPGDRSEADDARTPACSDHDDNDRDGLVDYPFDPGCGSAGDLDEADPAVAAACSNRVDDDGDGLLDYPADPGCVAAGDQDEANPAFAPQCANGRDDDNNGLIDWPNDPGCYAAADLTESAAGQRFVQCADGADNDGDGARDLADIGCESAFDDNEADLAVVPFCADGLDNDEDGDVDWPADFGCRAHGDQCEQAGFGLCREGCVDLVDNNLNCGSCGNACPDGITCVEGRCGGAVRPGVLVCGRSGRDVNTFIRGDLVDAIESVEQGCVPNDDIQAMLVPRGGVAEFTQNIGVIRPWVSAGGLVITEYNITDEVFNALFQANVVAGARGGSCNDNPQPVVQFSANDRFWQDNPFIPAPQGQSGCGFSINNYPGVTLLGGWDAANAFMGYRDLDAGRLWLLDIDWQDGQAIPEAGLDLVAYMIGNGGSGAVEIPPCLDGADNDDDGLIDLADPGCSGRDDPVEGDTPVNVPACADGADNDGDGRVDFPQDPGCVAAGDVDEADPAVPVQCANGLDDDGDGRIDFPFDPGCQGFGDEQERDPARRFACGNGQDDDGDGRVDYPADPGCESAADTDEAENAAELQAVPACADGLDNDRDGRVDWPLDVGCVDARDNDEVDPRVLPECGNGIDDDDDGRIDYPRDPGCEWASDSSEEGRAGFVPACANGIDDDLNNRIDWPDDPGCRSAADPVELTDGPVSRRCADGFDNDDDGLVDLADVGCEGSLDNDEDDPVEPPFCADGRDNDGDGQIDWPADNGCEAQGDVCEQAGFGLCDGVCTGLADNPENCGRCGHSCNPGIACNAGRCGDLRPVVMGCINSARPIQEFIRGELAEARLEVVAGCEPDDDVQAFLVSRNGLGQVQQSFPALLEYLEGGGQIITEFNISDDIFNGLFGAGFVQVPQRLGDCAANVQPAVQFGLDDPFWQDNEFRAVAAGATGCGNPIPANLRDFVALGGWDPRNVSMGYLDVGAGRLWLVEANWQDNNGAFTDESRDLMAAMIAGRDTRGGLPACGDARDNDGDGLFDAEDPGCSDELDREEGDPPGPGLPACADGEDNDGDGIIDFPFEPGCVMAGDDDEADPAEVPACANGIDDDNDGVIDFPSDPGCPGAGDDDETDPVRPARCSNGRDDDRDNRVDYPADPGCLSAADAGEDDGEEVAACGNQLDDDVDGLFDWPFDPGCATAGDDDETDPDPLPECANGIDDDDNGVIDFPLDPGCVSAGDEVEAPTRAVPECADNADNDADGAIDWPADVTCWGAGSVSESLGPRARPECNDGFDNDDDDAVDGADDGCQGPTDDDESDPVDGALCNNGEDDDEDGDADWPADPGCSALGDVCEQPLHTLCDGECTDTPNDAQNCGRCGRVCADGVECLNGFCGGLFTFDGIIQNTPQAEVESWRQCHQSLYGANNPLGPILEACDGEFVMYGCRRINAPEWQLLAMGDRDEVFRNTGDGNNAVNTHNGVDWYYSTGTSMGFTSVGTGVSRNSCDTANVVPEQRLCWHTSGNNMNGGWRCGAATGLNGDVNWERAIWTSE